MEITKELVLKALSKVEEPDLKKDLVTLNMVKDVEVDGKKISFTIVLTTPACPLKELIRKRCEDAIAMEIGMGLEVVIDMTADVTSIQSLNPTMPNVKNIIAVASGKGGVGKSTVSANLAVALAKTGASVGLIDADIYGPSVPVMFGLEDDKPAVVEEDGKNLVIPIRKFGVELISMGFLAPADNAIVWRGPMASSALRQFFNDVKWPELDYLLIDLPPGTSDIHLTMVQSAPITGAVIVTTPQKVALADAKKGLGMFKQPQINVPVLGVVENMAYFTPDELPDNKYYIFGKDGGKRLSEEYNTPFLGQLPIVESIREAGDEGTPIVMSNNIVAEAFTKLAENVAQQVAIRNASLPESEKVEITT